MGTASSNNQTRKRLILWFDELLMRFGHQGWWPVCIDGNCTPTYFHNLDGYTDLQEFEIAIGAILTQNTSWNNVLRALENLHRADVWSPEHILKLPTEDLEKLIAPSRYFRQKTKKLQIFSRAWINDKESLKTREGLLQLWGIGEETADDILLYAFRQPIFVIDTYTRRFLGTHGIEFATYAAYQNFFMIHLPHDYLLFAEYHALIVAWGQAQTQTRTRT